MALPKAGDRAAETSTTTGTGTFSLAGAIADWRTIVAACGTGETVDYYAVQEDGSSGYEVGRGVITDGTPDTLTRVEVFASSNGDALVNWGAGTREIVVTLTANAMEQLLAAEHIGVTVQGYDATLEIGATADQTKADIDGLGINATQLGGNSASAFATSGHAHAGTYLGLTAKASDSDKLDNINSSQFLRSDAPDIKTSGSLFFNDNINLYFGTGGDARFWCNGVHMYTDLYSGIGNWYIRDGATTRFTFDDAGHLTATGNVTAYSDRKLKKNIEVIPEALSKVAALSGYTFDRIDNPALGKQTGVIAQEVQEVIPSAVATHVDSDGSETLTVAYGNMVGLLIEAIKELKDEVDVLKANK